MVNVGIECPTLTTIVDVASFFVDAFVDEVSRAEVFDQISYRSSVSDRTSTATQTGFRPKGFRF